MLKYKIPQIVTLTRFRLLFDFVAIKRDNYRCVAYLVFRIYLCNFLCKKPQLRQKPHVLLNKTKQ